MAKGDNVQLVAFDMDGVLVDFHSSWVHLHNHFQTNNDHSLEAYYRGEIDDVEFIRRDIAMWLEKQPLIHISHIRDQLLSIPLMRGARETISVLNQKGIITVIISGGLDILALSLMERLGIDDQISNSLHIDSKGYLTGEGSANLLLRDKATPLGYFQKKYNIPPANCAAIGDSPIDVMMFKNCATGIAFNVSDERMNNHRDHIDHFVLEKDLRGVLKYIV